MKKFTGYKCDYCGKLYQRKHACESHEVKCMKNPDNSRPCLEFCDHLDRKQIEFDTGYLSDESGEPIFRKADGFYCRLKKQLMLHPKVENVKKLTEVFFGNEIVEQVPMPRHCNEFEDYSPF